MKTKHDTLRVESLKMGDTFVFLSSPSGESAAAAMVVTRSPSVNQAAGSCHFRYRTQAATGPGFGMIGRQDNQSWNGAPGTLVRLLDRSTIEPHDESLSAVAPPAQR